MEVCSRPLLIEPAADLLEKYPQLLRSARGLSRSYVFRELVTDDRLQAIGSSLWQALAEADGFAQAFADAYDYAGSKVLPIIVQSNEASIHNLPWEVLHHPEHGFLGREQHFTFSRRLPMGEAEPDTLEPGPLRVLLFTSLPEDLDAEKGRLAVEEEQEHVLEALMKEVLEGKVLLQMPNDGRFSSLKQQLREFKPHLVFLSGHGKFHQPEEGEPYGTFLFENEIGNGDAIKDTDLAAIFPGNGVGCVVLSACESGKAASDALNNGLARKLLSVGLPQVVGMRESILDRAGILFAQHFCDAVADRQRIDVALQEARRAIVKPLKDATWRDDAKSGEGELSLGQWCLPTLFSRDVEAPLIDWDFEPQAPEVDISKIVLDGVSVPAKFRGRRKELRQLGGAGANQQLLITGPGGQGKTALAGKLAVDLRAEGWEVASWSAREGKVWDGFLLDLQLRLDKQYAQVYDRVLVELKDKPTEKYRYLLEMLLTQYQGKFLVLLDNLETLQDIKSRSITDGEVQAFISAGQALEPKGMRLLLTSRWLLPDWQQVHWPLAHLSYGDFLQLCVLKGPQLAPLAQRQQRLRRVFEVMNGNARGLEFFAAAVQGMAVAEEDEFLQILAAVEDEVQTDMALQQLLDQRSEAQLALLHRMQCFEQPVPVEGIIRLAGELEEPEILMGELLALSLVEKSHHDYFLAEEYQASQLVTGAVNQRLGEEPGKTHANTAAAYQYWLFRNERPTIPQAQILHRAYKKADQIEQAHRLVLDVIIGPLSRAGLYHTLLDEWLPEICLSDDQQVRAKHGNDGKRNR